MSTHVSDESWAFFDVDPLDPLELSSVHCSTTLGLLLLPPSRAHFSILELTLEVTGQNAMLDSLATLLAIPRQDCSVDVRSEDFRSEDLRP